MNIQFQLICNYFIEANIFIQIIALITSFMIIILNTILFIIPCLIINSILICRNNIKTWLIYRYYLYKIQNDLKSYPKDILRIINKYNRNLKLIKIFNDICE